MQGFLSRTPAAVLTLMFIVSSLRSTLSFDFGHRLRNGRDIKTKGFLIMAMKYDPSKFIKVKVSKPLEIVLEEVEENKKRGLYVSEVSKSGNGAKSGISGGLLLIEACGIDVRRGGFDDVMDILRASPEGEPLELTFIDRQFVVRGDALIRVRQPDGSELTVKCPKGQLLRTVLLGSNVELYDLKGKMSNCGGGGQCGTCVVGLEVSGDPGQDWDPKPDFETKRLRKYDDNCRLSCNLIVEGDATVIIRPPLKSSV